MRAHGGCGSGRHLMHGNSSSAVVRSRRASARLDAEPGSRCRMQAWRARARAAGLKLVHVWVPDGCRAAVRDLAERMRVAAGICLPRDGTSEISVSSSSERPL